MLTTTPLIQRPIFINIQVQDIELIGKLGMRIVVGGSQLIGIPLGQQGKQQQEEHHTQQRGHHQLGTQQIL